MRSSSKAEVPKQGMRCSQMEAEMETKRAHSCQMNFPIAYQGGVRRWVVRSVRLYAQEGRGTACWLLGWEDDDERQEADRNERAQLDEEARESKLERIYRLDQRE